MSDIADLIIIGSGPAGYTAAIYAARADLSPIVIEGGVTSGGALMNTTEVENFPGFPDGVMGPDLMMNMRSQAEKFGAHLITEDAVKIELEDAVKVVTIEDGTQYRARAVILAMGSGYRKLGLDSEDRLSGRGVSWCATCDGAFFRDRDIAVIGGGDSALEEATFLTRFGRSVTVIHRRDQLRASKAMIERANKDPKLSFRWNSVIESVDGDTSVTGLTLKDTVTGELSHMPVAGVFVAIGHNPRSDLVRGQVDLDSEGYVLTAAHSTATNLDGVFACGDLVDHTYRQAITAAGSGCQSALDAERYLSTLGI